MAQFCNPGDTARVVLPNEFVEEYSDTPITITCNPIEEDCARVFVTCRTERTHNSTGVVTVSENTVGCQTPIGNVRISPFDNLQTQIECRGSGSSTCRVFGWYLFQNLSPFGGNKWTKIEIISISNYYRLIITGNTGTELHNQLYSNCNYQIECIPGCPPNTIDCGDCCLPCDSIFNQISALHAQVARLN